MSTAQNLREDRLKKLEKIREIGWNPYPSSYEKKQMIGKTREMEGQVVKTAGKLFSFRTHGNIAFAVLDCVGCPFVECRRIQNKS